MMVLLSQAQDVKQYFFPVYHYQSDSGAKTTAVPPERPRDLSTRHRDAAVWYLLEREDRVAASDLRAYWEIMDAMMEMSTQSAIFLLQRLYEYRVRALTSQEMRREYPGVNNPLYRLTYDDDDGGHRDVCAGTLIHEALDVLQEEAERLIRS